MKITKSELLRRIEALEQENKQRGIGNQFMTLKCIQGNRHFTKDATYCASKLFDRTVITTNFGSRKELTVNTNIFGGYKVTGENQTAVFQVIGADVEAEPKLKQLDQSVFDGLDAKWRFAAVDSNGEVRLQMSRPVLNRTNSIWVCCGQPEKSVGMEYDTTDWQNSLIERDKAELTGSDLCRKMLERGDKVVLCRVSNISDEVSSRCCAPFYAITHVKFYENEGDWHFFHKQQEAFLCAVPINNQGEPLTQSEVGL